MIRRHTASAMLLHWFNALCWLLLLATGFALLQNPHMQPLGMWWPALWDKVLSPAHIIVVHTGLGLVWTLGCSLYVLLRWRQGVCPFLREIFTLSPAVDLRWCRRKALELLLGDKNMRALGLDPSLPPQGFYNAGQKYMAIASIVCCAGLVCSGGLLLATPYVAASPELVQWALLVHFACAGSLAIALPVHIYMAALAPGEGPALRSMLTGHVPVDFIQHHNPLWHDRLVREGKISAKLIVSTHS